MLRAQISGNLLGDRIHRPITEKRHASDVGRPVKEIPAIIHCDSKNGPTLKRYSSKL